LRDTCYNGRMARIGYVKAPIIIAHRTCPPYAPENSLEGVRVAVEQGADGIEIDLRSSLDLQPYLMHDNTMSRTTGFPLPIEATPAFIVRQTRLRVGSDEYPPSLSQFLDAVPSDKLLAIDLKTPWAAFPLIREVKRRRIQDRTLVWCSSARVAQFVRWRLPGVEVAYYKDYEDGPNNLAFIAKARDLGVHAVSLDWRAIDFGIVEAAHLAGLKVYSWHKEYEITKDKLESGLDGLITDHPARSRALIDGF
jgi:glycerophosphoryl diester phosphodiesterase